MRLVGCLCVCTPLFMWVNQSSIQPGNHLIPGAPGLCSLRTGLAKNEQGCKSSESEGAVLRPVPGTNKPQHKTRTHHALWFVFHNACSVSLLQLLLLLLLFSV